MKIFQIFLALLLVVLLAVALSSGIKGCTMEGEGSGGGTGSAANQPKATGEMVDGKGKKIGFSIAMLAGSPYWQTIAGEMKRGFGELNYEFVVLDGQGDAAKQASDFEDLMSLQVDMILVNPYDSDAIVPATLSARDAGIPVIAIDIPVGDKGYCVATTICDNFELGYRLGEYSADKMSSVDVKVVVISGYPNGIDSRLRRMGYIEGFHAKQLEKHARTGLEIVHHGWGDYAREPANKAMEDAITRTSGDFDIVYAECDDMSIGALHAMEAAGIEGKMILGIDGLKEMLALIKEGKTTATGLNSPTELAALTVTTVHNYLNGIEVPVMNYTTPAVIDSTNVNKYYDPNSIF